MTDEQINAAIAEACGWTEIGECENGGFRLRGLPSDRFEAHRKPIPNYCTDLNAMHEAEKTLTDYEQIYAYVDYLQNRDDWHTHLLLLATHITARQRAEAFLRTLGKWEATTEDSSAVQTKEAK
jgi:hypothetical protein